MNEIRIPEPTPSTGEPQVPAPKAAAARECDHGAELQALHTKFDRLLAAIGDYQAHLGDVHANMIGDVLDVRMKYATVVNTAKRIEQRQVALTEAVCDLVTSNQDVAEQLHGVVDAALDLPEDDAEGERPA